MIISKHFRFKILQKLSKSTSYIILNLQLIIFLLTHFDKPRNFLASFINDNVLKVSVIHEPNEEIAVISLILFLSSFLNHNTIEKKYSNYIENIIYEFRVILENFYFYIMWIFTFLFSIANNCQTFIKFLLLLVFAFGKFSSNLLICSSFVFLKSSINSFLVICVSFLY